MTAGPRIESYAWAGGREHMLRFGDGMPRIALALPLFEEANRTRAFAVTLLRALADRGVASVLPDLPGQGESERATSAVTLGDLRRAFAALDVPNVMAIRSGALLLPGRPAWLLSPQSGPDLLRELTRIKGAPLEGNPVEVAGNVLSRTLLDQLADAAAGAGRVVRLSSDPAPADHKLDGPALWRRSEPCNDPGLAQSLAADIAEWIVTCEA